MKVSACCGRTIRKTSEHPLQGCFQGRFPNHPPCRSPRAVPSRAPVRRCRRGNQASTGSRRLRTGCWPSLLRAGSHPSRASHWERGIFPRKTPTASLALERNRRALRQGEHRGRMDGQGSTHGCLPQLGGEGLQDQPLAPSVAAAVHELMAPRAPRGLCPPARRGGAQPQWDFYGNPGTARGRTARTICSPPAYPAGERSVFGDDISTKLSFTHRAAICGGFLVCQTRKRVLGAGQGSAATTLSRPVASV